MPTPVFLPGEFHGQRSLAGYTPWDAGELDTTGRLTLSVVYPLGISSGPTHSSLCGWGTNRGSEGPSSMEAHPNENPKPPPGW